MESWKKNVPLLNSGFCDDIILNINELRKTRTVYPAESDVFAALKLVRFNEVKAVIIGQDPYHGPGQAHGLSFSVPKGVKPPPSLKNIFKEISTDVYPEQDYSADDFSTDLSHWAKQGVLLLNASLTVEEKKPGSHKNSGWLKITDQIIDELSKKRNNLIFLLWGAYAQSKTNLIDETRHLVLEAPHPSPLSSYRGFFGCRHFSKTNQYLLQNGKSEINW